VIVTHHYNGPECETPSALQNLGRAGDMNYTLIELFTFFLAFARLATILGLLAFSLLFAWHYSPQSKT
jgi:hypothetical protein